MRNKEILKLKDLLRYHGGEYRLCLKRPTSIVKAEPYNPPKIEEISLKAVCNEYEDMLDFMAEQGRRNAILVEAYEKLLTEKKELK